MAVVTTCLSGRGIGLDGAKDRQVVGLGPAAGEHQFLGVATQQSGDLAARGFQSLLG